MATAEESESELPGSIGVNVTRTEDIEQFREIQRHIAEKRDCSTDDVPRTDVLRALMRQYQFHRLEEDQRIKEARHAVASDHNLNMDDVTLRSLLKITAGAYCGYRQTDDWLNDA
jgi:hypothetical protein